MSRSLFVSGGKGDYPGLFGQNAPPGGAANDFSRRFGIQRLYQRNENLLRVLEKPGKALSDVNKELLDKSNFLSTQYGIRLGEFRVLGFGEEECKARADIMIGRDLENELSLMQLKYPYAMGGAEAGGWDPVSAALMQNPDIRALPRTMRAIDSTHMGISEVKGIKKGGEKRRLKKKFRRKYGKKH